MELRQKYNIKTKEQKYYVKSKNQIAERYRTALQEYLDKDKDKDKGGKHQKELQSYLEKQRLTHSIKLESSREGWTVEIQFLPEDLEEFQSQISALLKKHGTMSSLYQALDTHMGPLGFTFDKERLRSKWVVILSVKSVEMQEKAVEQTLEKDELKAFDDYQKKLDALYLERATLERRQTVLRKIVELHKKHFPAWDKFDDIRPATVAELPNREELSKKDCHLQTLQDQCYKISVGNNNLKKENCDTFNGIPAETTFLGKRVIRKLPDTHSVAQVLENAETLLHHRPRHRLTTWVFRNKIAQEDTRWSELGIQLATIRELRTNLMARMEDLSGGTEAPWMQNLLIRCMQRGIPPTLQKIGFRIRGVRRVSISSPMRKAWLRLLQDSGIKINGGHEPGTKTAITGAASK